MKILCAADHHFDKSSRWDECRRIHNWMFELAVRERVDLFISCGDIYERASTPEERIAVAEWLCAMAEQCPVLVVKGNHDTPRDLELLGKLDAAHPITVEETAGVHLFCHAELAVAAVAWPDRARILSAARKLGRPETDTLAQDAYRDVLRGLGEDLAAHKGPTLAVGHFMVDGAVVSTGQPLIGQAMNLGLSDLALLQTGLVVCGHIHKPQCWRYGDQTDIVYTGSPYRTSYGETEDKSVLLVTLDEPPAPGRAAHTVMAWRREQTPCSRMLLIEDEWGFDVPLDGNHAVWTGGEPHALEHPAGAEIRFRYAVAPDMRESARASAAEWKQRWLDAGALSVQVEECVRTHSIARAPEVAAAKTLGEKLQALWIARGTTPEEPRRQTLLLMAAELEEELRP